MVAVFARKVVIAISVFTFNLCTSQGAFEQKHLEILFLELFLFMFFRVIFVSDFNVPKKTCSHTAGGTCCNGFSNNLKQTKEQTNSQTDKQLQTRRSVLKGLSMRIIYSQVFEQQQSIKISFCTYCKS